MSRDHDFETKMREACVGMGQIGLMRVARAEHDKVDRLAALLREVNDWMDNDVEPYSHGVELSFRVKKMLEELGSAYGERK